MGRQADNFLHMRAAFRSRQFAHADHAGRAGNPGQSRRNFFPGQDIGGIHKVRRAGRIQTAGDIQYRGFPHAVHDQIQPGVRQKRLAQAVRPEVIMADAPQGRLYAPRNDRQTGKGPAHQRGVHAHRPVRTRSGSAARRVGVVMPLFAERRIVSQHGVHRTRRHADKQTWTPHAHDIIRRVPAGLGHNAHPVPVRLQPAPKKRRAEGGMIHIGVAGHQQYIQLLPAAPLHVFPAHGQKEPAVAEFARRRRAPGAPPFTALPHGRIERNPRALRLPERMKRTAAASGFPAQTNRLLFRHGYPR